MYHCFGLSKYTKWNLTEKKKKTYERLQEKLKLLCEEYIDKKEILLIIKCFIDRHKITLKYINNS